MRPFHNPDFCRIKCLRFWQGYENQCLERCDPPPPMMNLSHDDDDYNDDDRSLHIIIFPRRLHMNIWKDATRLLATRWLSASRDLELSPAHAGFLNRNCKLVAKIINLITKSKNGVPSRGPRDAPTLWLIRRHESWVMTFMTQGNVIFDILETNAVTKYGTCWVF